MAEFSKPALTPEELEKVRGYLGTFMQAIEEKSAKIVVAQLEKINRGPNDSKENIKKAQDAFERSLTPYKRRPITYLSQARFVFRDIFGKESDEAIWLLFKAAFLSTGPVAVAVAEFIQTGHVPKLPPSSPTDKNIETIVLERLPKIEAIFKKDESGKDSVSAGLAMLLDMYKPDAETPEAASLQEVLRRENQNLRESLQQNLKTLSDRREFVARAKKALAEAEAAKAAGKKYEPPTWEDITAQTPGGLFG